jgi:hypothetical protein
MTQLVLSNHDVAGANNAFTNYWEVPPGLTSLLVVVDVSVATTESF